MPKVYKYVPKAKRLHIIYRNGLNMFHVAQNGDFLQNGMWESLLCLERAWVYLENKTVDLTFWRLASLPGMGIKSESMLIMAT